MALIDCPDCGRRVSDAAVACPDCARPIAGAESGLAAKGQAAARKDDEKTEANEAAGRKVAATLATKRDDYAITNLARSLKGVSHDVAGKKCPRCGKDLRADYVLISERTGELCCLACAEKSSKLRQANRRTKLRLQQLGPTLVLLSILAGAIAVGAYAVATAPASQPRPKK